MSYGLSFATSYLYYSSLNSYRDKSKVDFKFTYLYSVFMPDLMRIGELAERTHTPPETIRYYERLKLLGPTQREGKGHRHYDEVAVRRLNKISFLKQLGLSLEEIGEVIDLYFEDAQGLRGKKRVLDILREHRQGATQKLSALQAFVDELDENIERTERLVENLEHRSE